jgi:hypothetical protein
MRWRHPVLALLLLLVACADAPTTPGDGGSIEHATGRTDLLVRVAFEGGLVAAEENLTSVPIFSLYGDGTLVTPGAQIEIYPAPALPAISSRTIDEAGVQAILGETIDAIEGVPDDLDDLGSMAIADAPWTVLTVNARGVDRTIRAIGLCCVNPSEQPQGMPDEVFQGRRQLERLVTRLGGLDWLPADSLGGEGMYEGESARLFVTKYRKVDDLPQEPVSWPITGALSSFGDPTQPTGYRCGTLSGDGWDIVRQEASRANQLTPWTDGADRFSVLFRPLLPDESGC